MNTLSGINVIITSSSSITNEGNLNQLSTFFTEKGLNMPFLSPIYLLDKISKISSKNNLSVYEMSNDLSASNDQYNALIEGVVDVPTKKNKKAKYRVSL
jgi:hypothetical protein